jgi:hypothetical protein
MILSLQVLLLTCFVNIRKIKHTKLLSLFGMKRPFLFSIGNTLIVDVMIYDLFRLFAKVLLAPRPFAKSLKKLKFCSKAEGNCLLYLLGSVSLGGCT